MDYNQLFLALFGVTAIFAVNDYRPHISRWGPVLGLCSQPFWFYMAITKQEWGVVVLSVFYTIGWFRGLVSKWGP